jgi:hypothetical protein
MGSGDLSMSRRSREPANREVTLQCPAFKGFRKSRAGFSCAGQGCFQRVSCGQRVPAIISLCLLACY